MAKSVVEWLALFFGVTPERSVYYAIRTVCSVSAGDLSRTVVSCVPLPLSHSPTNPLSCPLLFPPVFPVFPALQEWTAHRLVKSKAAPILPQAVSQLPKPMTANDLGLALPSKAIQPPLSLPLLPKQPFCSWLEALLELHWCTSWDLCLAQRLWTGKP